VEEVEVKEPSTSAGTKVRLYTLLADIKWTLSGSHIMLTTRMIRDVQPLDAVQHQQLTLIRKSAYIRCVELYYHLWDNGPENSPKGSGAKGSPYRDRIVPARSLSRGTWFVALFLLFSLFLDCEGHYGVGDMQLPISNWRKCSLV